MFLVVCSSGHCAASRPHDSANSRIPPTTESGYYLNMVKTHEQHRFPYTEEEIVATGLVMLRDRLPSDWSFAEAAAKQETSGADDALTLRSPDGGKLDLVVEARRLLDIRDIPGVVAKLDRRINGATTKIGIVGARYLAESVRQRLIEAGVSYFDTTGNILVRAQVPAVYISDRGADRDPGRGPGRPRGTLKGEPAAKVVRTLLDLQGPWKISDLVKTSGSSTGSAYRVIEFLESEALVSRERNGLIAVPDWSALLRRWSDDYQFLRTNTTTQWITPRGIDSLLEKVRAHEVSDYAITGSIAAATWAPFAPIRSAMIYTPNPEHAAEAWGLRAVDAGANVVLARPRYEVLLKRTVDRTDGLRVAAPAQVAADLMTGPGRAPSEAEELVNWMRSNEQFWR